MNLKNPLWIFTATSCNCQLKKLIEKTISNNWDIIQHNDKIYCLYENKLFN